MNLQRTLLIAMAALATCSLGGRADAQCGGYGGFGGYGGYGYGGPWGIGQLYGVLADNVPYFAAFPPVYYSQPVPRTYGYSPFAYPPGVMTPEVVETVQPVTIENPYYSGEVKEAAANGKAETVDQTTSVAPAAPGPLVILNPYVSQNGGAAGLAATSAASQR